MQIGPSFRISVAALLVAALFRPCGAWCPQARSPFHVAPSLTRRLPHSRTALSGAQVRSLSVWRWTVTLPSLRACAAGLLPAAGAFHSGSRVGLVSPMRSRTRSRAAPTSVSGASQRKGASSDGSAPEKPSGAKDPAQMVTQLEEVESATAVLWPQVFDPNISFCMHTCMPQTLACWQHRLAGRIDAPTENSTEM